MRTQEEIDYYTGKTVEVKYYDDAFVYTGIVSGYNENMMELIIGFDEAQNGEDGWNLIGYSDKIRHPRNMYFWAFKEDCEIEVVK